MNIAKLWGSGHRMIASEPRGTQIRGALLAAIISILIPGCGNSEIPFDQTAWIGVNNDPDREVSDIRFRMVKSLTQSHTLIGLNGEQIIQLLGPAEASTSSDSNEAWYLLREKWDVIDPIEIDYLVLSFGPDNRVIKWRLKIHDLHLPDTHG